MEKQEKKYFSVAEIAKILGISRVAVFNRIKKGQIPAEKIGRAYFISAENTDEIIGTKLRILTDSQKRTIEKVVKKTVEEYGETLKLLGKE